MKKTNKITELMVNAERIVIFTKIKCVCASAIAVQYEFYRSLNNGIEKKLSELFCCIGDIKYSVLHGAFENAMECSIFWLFAEIRVLPLDNIYHNNPIFSSLLK